MLQLDLRPSGSLDGSRLNPGRLPVRVDAGAPYTSSQAREWPRMSKPHLGDQIAHAKEDIQAYDVVISPGCHCTSENGRIYKNRYYPHFDRVIRHLQAKNISYILNLYKKDYEVFQDLPGPWFDGSIVELMVLLSKAKLLVSVESGTAHLGTLVGIPVVELLSTHEPGFPSGEARVVTPIKTAVYGLIEPQIGDIDPRTITNIIDWSIDDGS